MIRQAGEQADEKSSFSDFLKIKYCIFNGLFWLVRLIIGTDSVQSVC